MADIQRRAPWLLTIGEALYDRVEGEGLHLGGAPLNVALHAAQLGARASLWSAVGRDPLGVQLISALQAGGVSTDWVSSHPDRETGVVEVSLDPQSGEPSYLIKEGVAWDALEWHEGLSESLGSIDAISYGSLSLRGAQNRSALSALWEAIEQRRAQGGSTPLCVFDINLRPPFIDWSTVDSCLEASDALKLNHEEWATLCKRHLSDLSATVEGLTSTEREVREARGLIERFGLSWLVVTHGAKGLTLHHRDGYVQASGPEATTGDRVGAGDATNAALIVSLLMGRGWDEATHIAARCGAFVASQHGATPTLPEELRALF